MATVQLIMMPCSAAQGGYFESSLQGHKFHKQGHNLRNQGRNIVVRCATLPLPPSGAPQAASGAGIFNCVGCWPCCRVPQGRDPDLPGCQLAK